MSSSDLQTTKSFEDISEDYSFFESHSTEATETIKVLGPILAREYRRYQSITLLDFGCGDGGFTARVLSCAGLSPNALKIMLVDPNEVYLQKATTRLTRYTSTSILAHTSLSELHGSTFDIILSNHALYYVSDLTEVLSAFATPRGNKGYFTVATEQNSLIRGWRFLFSLLDKEPPFLLPENITGRISKMARSLASHRVQSELRFPDTVENKSKIIRFLMGKHANELPSRNDAFIFFEDFKIGSEIVLPLEDVIHEVLFK